MLSFEVEFSHAFRNIPFARLIDFDSGYIRLLLGLGMVLQYIK